MRRCCLKKEKTEMHFLCNRQRLELVLLVAIKAALFYVIWLVFFSHPVTENLNDQKMVDRLMGAQVNSAHQTKRKN